MGGIVITNDGHCILREVDVSHPTAKSMMELSRAQDEEVGDGTTSVIILAGEMLVQSETFLRDDVHPTVIVQAYHKALQEAMEICERCVAFFVVVIRAHRLRHQHILLTCTFQSSCHCRYQGHGSDEKSRPILHWDQI